MPALGKADGSIVIEALMDTGSAERGLKKIKSGANSLSASLKKNRRNYWNCICC